MFYPLIRLESCIFGYQILRHADCSKNVSRQVTRSTNKQKQLHSSASRRKYEKVCSYLELDTNIYQTDVTTENEIKFPI